MRIQQRRDVWRHIGKGHDPTDAECLTWARDQLRRRGLAERDTGTLPAYINHDRWLIDCECYAGIVVSPESEVAICIECGRCYRVLFPSDREAIETILLDRESHHRNWLPHEMVDDLLAENRKHLEVELAGFRERVVRLEKLLGKKSS